MINVKYFFCVFLLVFVAIFLQAQTFGADLKKPNLKTNKYLKNQLVLEKNKTLNTNTNKTKNIFSAQLTSEGGLLKNQISKNQSEFYPYIPYTELGFYYSKNKTLDMLINFEMESNNKEWSISLDEFSISYTFQDIPFSVKTGWFPLPLGYMDKNINVFSKELFLYNSITRNREDMGLTARVHILQSALFLQMDYFGGWSWREWDNSYNQPESAPIALSLKSQGSVWDFFISWFKEDLAFFNPVQSLGAGAHLKISYKKLRVAIQSEFWRSVQEGQTTLSYYVFPSITIDKLKMGVVFESVNHFSPDFKTSQSQSSIYERVFQIAYQIHPNVTIIGERFISTQRKGPLFRDLWSARVKMDFSYSNFL